MLGSRSSAPHERAQRPAARRQPLTRRGDRRSPRQLPGASRCWGTTWDEDRAHLCLVRLEGPPAALHLTHQSSLDALGLDDRVNTARLDQPLPGGGELLLAVSQHLADAVYDWWAATPPPIVTRTRSVPAARSIAFTRSVTWESVSVGRLRDASALLVALVTHHGFDVPEAWLSRPSSGGCAAASARCDQPGDRSERPMPRGGACVAPCVGGRCGQGVGRGPGRWPRMTRWMAWAASRSWAGRTCDGGGVEGHRDCGARAVRRRP